MDFSLSSLSSEPSAPLVGDRRNIRGNLKHSILELEFVIQYDKDNYLVIKLRPIDMRCITLLPFPKVISSANPEDGDKANFMLELHWIQDDIR